MSSRSKQREAKGQENQRFPQSIINALISCQATSLTTSHQESYMMNDLHRGEKGGRNGLLEGSPWREITHLVAPQPPHSSLTYSPCFILLLKSLTETRPVNSLLSALEGQSYPAKPRTQTQSLVHVKIPSSPIKSPQKDHLFGKNTSITHSPSIYLLECLLCAGHCGFKSKVKHRQGLCSPRALTVPRLEGK